MDIKKLINLVLEDDESYINIQQDFVSLSNEDQLWLYIVLASDWIMNDIKTAYSVAEVAAIKGKYTTKYVQKLVLTELENLLVYCNHPELYLRLLAIHQSVLISANDYLMICCLCFSDIDAKDESLLSSIIHFLVERYTAKVDNFSHIEQALVTYEFQLHKLHHLEERRDGNIQ
jgi:hypothetical protein